MDTIFFIASYANFSVSPHCKIMIKDRKKSKYSKTYNNQWSSFSNTRQRSTLEREREQKPNQKDQHLEKGPMIGEVQSLFNVYRTVSRLAGRDLQPWQK